VSKPKQKKNGTRTRAKKSYTPHTIAVGRDEIVAALAKEQGESRRTMRLLLRVIAWLMQHRDQWTPTEARVPLVVMNEDVDVGLFHDHETGHLLVVPAPPTLPVEEPREAECTCPEACAKHGTGAQAEGRP